MKDVQSDRRTIVETKVSIAVDFESGLIIIRRRNLDLKIGYLSMVEL